MAVTYGLILGAIHFFSDKLRTRRRIKPYRLISFAAGVSIAYLFLDLLPHTYKAAVHLKNFVFVFLLLGFVIIHVSEKFIYQHAERDRRARELKEIHSIVFFLYHFLVGLVLQDRIQDNLLEGTLFLVPITLHAGLSTASLAQIHGDIRESLAVKTWLSLSTCLGVIFSRLVSIPSMIDNISVSLISGVLLYVFVKEFLPEKEKGQPLFFLLGLLLFTAFYISLASLKT